MALSQLEQKTTIDNIKKTFAKRILDVVAQDNTIRVIVAETSSTYRKALLGEIAQSLGVTYAATGDRTGYVSLKGTKLVVKPGTVSAAGVAKVPPMLKPVNIKPSIVGVWLDAETMTRNVQQYINTQDFDADEKKQINDLLKLISSDAKTSYSLPNFPRKLVPSEFYEVLSAIKLSKLLSVNDRKIRNVLGVPAELDLSRLKIKINIPVQANMPLLDYWININNTADEDSSMKISVKSKVSSPKTNTVKFEDTFKGSSPDSWYADLPRALKSENVAQRIIAQAVLDAYKLPGTNTRNSQIVPLQRLLKSEKKSEIERILTSFKVKIADIPVLERMLETLLKQTSKTGATKLSDLISGSELALAENMTSHLPDPNNTFAAILYIFDSVIQESSRERSQTHYNFYQMFFDEVLKRNNIAYAVSSYKANTLHFDYYSLINWADEYKKYIALRHQSSSKGINSSIGLDV